MVDREKVKTSLKKIKGKMRAIVDKHATEAGMLVPDNPDPHLPILGVAQMALAQALVEFLQAQGVPLPEAIRLTAGTTSNAMQTWLNQLYRGSFSEVQENR